MSQTKEINLDELADSWRQLWLDNWATVTKQAVDFDTFKNFNSAWLNWSLSSQKLIRDSVTQNLELVDIPKRSDLARISRQVAALEGRILELQEELERLPTREDLRRLEQLLKSKPTPKPAPKKGSK